MAEKTKQHFVPKMLLKRYSWDGVFVNICNIRESTTIKSVPYDPQCQKRYFYGKDKRLEDALGEIETVIDGMLNRLVNNCIIPSKKISGESLNDYEVRTSILSFVFIQYTRTQMAKDLVVDAVNRDFELFKRNDKEKIIDSLKSTREFETLDVTEELIEQAIDSLSIKINNPFDHIFMVAKENYEENKHLKGVLLFNTSNIPFITSDNPVVNVISLFPERVMSFFMPITPAHCLFYFDERYYEVDGSDNVVSIFDAKEVTYINTLQAGNCKGNIYLPRISSDLKICNLLRGDKISGIFFNYIKAISLKGAYGSHMTHPLSSGFARCVNVICE
ncbi:DUF4238 domain-containing protein [Enterobacter asburiae]|nr:DUF4238 domain-containing protein [Enterobacter asburiae]